MAAPDLVNISGLMDDVKCFAFVRQHRWPEGVCCPGCGSSAVIRDGCDDTQPHRQRYRCKACTGRFDDLTGTVLAGHHQPLRVWVLCLYFMGLNLSNQQTAGELGLAVSDVQATRRVVDQQDGPVILVGHSYGGAVITEAGGDPKVRSLVYVAAFQPEVGETVGALGASMPSLLSPTAMKASSDGYVTIDPAALSRDIAGDLPAADSTFMAASQIPTNASVFSQKITTAAWRGKKSYAILATEDRTISPALERWMYRRSGAEVTEIKSSHVVYISHPQAVAAVIERAAREVK